MKDFNKGKSELKEKYFPDKYINKITDLDSTFFKKNNLNGIIIDIDNTIIDENKKMIDGLLEWKNEITKNGIKLVILTNTIDKPKVAKLAKLLDVDFFYLARKPRLQGFRKARANLDLPTSEIAVIGDQMFTDILGANKSKMYSILVNPLKEHLDFFLTKYRRPFEEKILIRYLQYIKETEKDFNKYKEVLKVIDERLKNQKENINFLYNNKLLNVLKSEMSK